MSFVVGGGCSEAAIARANMINVPVSAHFIVSMLSV